ncbi:MAG: type II/IV secretion system protein [Verrucomicrobia bacterium]|nr:type II/IV secretion system protein [Verrucomicrobiota bacterium]MBT4901534.1 type II/IV secretion system protein [Verrucomicrobiota bacterium]MDB4703422.1 GspE/PulE family protein [bacterium]MDB4789880.1 GspE/PulE family protein [bacterium]
MSARDDYLLETLTEMGVVTDEERALAEDESMSSGEGIVDTLVTKGVVMAIQVSQAKAAQFGAEFVEIAEQTIEDDVISSVPRSVAHQYKVVPLYQDDLSVTVAMSDPSDLDVIDALGQALNKEVKISVADEDEIEDALKQYYGAAKDDSVSKLIQDITEGDVQISTLGEVSVEEDGGAVDADTPIIKLVNTMIVEAFRLGASDIHLEPLAARFRMRYRIDGVCHEQKSPPRRLQASVISRLKIMSEMDIAEKRVPQDGRIQANVGGKSIDLRVSCLPTTHGESIVMRLLDKEGLKLGLGQLGFLADDQQTFEKLIQLPDGILLVTGPTGSGKTTTLYSCLNYINKPDRKIITVEDPVEYLLEGINQVQVNTAVELTFANALRAMLRQAPNVVMLGEIRDYETASIAINASLTGHLVFSTLHTNDAPSAVTRLTDIGVKPFLIASATRCLMAQRLVRKVCPKCEAPTTPDKSDLLALGLDPDKIKDPNFLAGKGCDKCNGTGHKGRFGLFEVFVVDDESRKMIVNKVTTTELRRRAREVGMRTLREDGARKAVAGMTTANEVLRVTVGDED